MVDHSYRQGKSYPKDDYRTTMVKLHTVEGLVDHTMEGLVDLLVQLLLLQRHGLDLAE